jgi:dephospho-CoA kinase
MPFPRIIAICGARRCGKDTLAHILEEHYGYKHLKISQELKSIVSQLFSFNQEQLENDNKDFVDERYGITPREIMQFFGTEMMQYKLGELLPSMGKKFWIKLFIERYIKTNPYEKIVVSDMRFIHEYEELKKYNALVVQIKRNNNPYKNDKLDNHISEKEYKEIPVDLMLENNDSRTAFEKSALKAISQYIV